MWKVIDIMKINLVHSLFIVLVKIDWILMNLSPGARRIFEIHTSETELRDETVSILFVKVTLVLFAWLVSCFSCFFWRGGCFCFLKEELNDYSLFMTLYDFFSENMWSYWLISIKFDRKLEVSKVITFLPIS